MKWSNSLALVTIIGISILSAGFIFKTTMTSERSLNLNTVTELVVTPFEYPHPYKLNHVAQYRFVQQVGEFLVRRDNKQNIIGGLAQSWTISSDRKTIIFHLRPHLYSAYEVAQSLKRLIRTKQTSHSKLAHQVSDEHDIIVIDSLNLKLKTSGDAGAVLAPLVMADTAILPDDHWVKIPETNELQVDWTKTKGPYVYVSGDIRNPKASEILFKPNPNHYFYSRDQLNWNIVYRPIASISDLSEFKQLLDRQPTFSTVRFWEALQIFASKDPGLSFY